MFQYDVFLSYSSQDQAVVLDLAERLRRDGLRVWLDQWVIQPGDSIPSKVEQGLERSRVLILCMSEGAFGSGWVSLERHTAMFRDPTNQRRRFIPIRLDDTPIKETLRQFAYVDWRQQDPKEYQRLIESCQDLEAEAKPELSESERWMHDRVQTISLGHIGAINGVAISLDGKRGLTGSDDGTVKLWDPGYLPADSGGAQRECLERRLRSPSHSAKDLFRR